MRVYDHVVSLKQINSDADREDLASRIIQSFQHGVNQRAAMSAYWTGERSLK